MVATLGKKPASYADIEALPENLVGEIIDGELYTHARPAGPHTVAASQVLIDLGMRFGRTRGPGGWWILSEPELHLGGDVLVPDIGGWRRSRMPDVPASHRFEIPPDWVAEVLSPATRRLDRVKKIAVYARHGVEWLWYVDPEAQSLEIYQLQAEHYVHIAAHAGDVTVHAPPFDDLALDLTVLWQTKD